LRKHGDYNEAALIRKEAPDSRLYLSNRIADKRTGAHLLRQDIFRNRSTSQFNRAHSFRSLLDFDTA
jgi:hypothetical protein